PWDVGVEQLGHVPAEHERRDDRVPGGVGAVRALGRCHGAPSCPSWGGGGPGVEGICTRLARTLGMLANAALPDKARPLVTNWPARGRQPVRRRPGWLRLSCLPADEN